MNESGSFIKCYGVLNCRHKLKKIKIIMLLIGVNIFIKRAISFYEQAIPFKKGIPLRFKLILILKNIKQG